MYYHLYPIPRTRCSAGLYPYHYNFNQHSQSSNVPAQTASLPGVSVYHHPPNYTRLPVPLVASAQKPPLPFKQHRDPQPAQYSRRIVPDSMSDYLVLSILAQSNALKRARQLCEQTDQQI